MSSNNPSLAIATNALGSFITKATATPYALSLGLGLASSSYFFWGNVAGHFQGVPRLVVNASERAKAGLDINKAVELWAWTYEKGAKHFGGSAVLGSLGVALAAVQIPPSSFTDKPRMARNYLFGLSLLLATPAIFTFATMLPTINKLHTLRNQVRSARSSSAFTNLTTAQEVEADKLMTKWYNLHYVRIALGGLGWLGAVAAYLTV